MRLRAPRREEAEAVLAVLADRDSADFGRPDVTLEDVLEEWSASDYDIALDCRVCETERGEMLAYANVRRMASFIAVSPEHDHGDSAALLLNWAGQRQRELGWPRLRQAAAAANEPLATLLESHGYVLERSHYRMRRELNSEVSGGETPDGVVLRTLDRNGDAEAVYEIDRLAFANVVGTEDMPLGEFVERHVSVHDLDPALSLLAMREQTPIGFLLTRVWREEQTGYVDILGVLPTEHGRGIGRALLLTAFDRYRQSGLREAQLGVSAENPNALRLYERAGMSPRFQIDLYERDAD
ncbi:MAG TPA: GNAT family N-acetyltransferase [Solirubrobacteraceae bacterium]|nr:GNAT family N-acetyltransferase [Solirubrobacteraceae bacterium]